MKAAHAYFPKASLALALAFSLQPSALLGQGGLTPPGAPGPTMKTLGQIEPRRPISSAPFVINQPGSYYLTTNLSVNTGNAITIATNSVTLDLGGWTISSTATSAAGHGILLASNFWDITIYNGHIRGGVTNNGSGTYSGIGFGYGIYYSGHEPANVRVTGLSVSGCRYHGIYLWTGDSTVVENCVVRTAGGCGIVASTVKSCAAMDCGANAIQGRTVADSRGACTGSSAAIYASTAQNCYGHGSGTGGGIQAISAQNCYGASDGSGTGLYATVAQNCHGYSAGSGTGLSAGKIAIGCYGSSSSGVGLEAMIANSCRGESNSGTGQSITYKYNMP